MPKLVLHKKAANVKAMEDDFDGSHRLRHGDLRVIYHWDKEQSSTPSVREATSTSDLVAPSAATSAKTPFPLAALSC